MRMGKVDKRIHEINMAFLDGVHADVKNADSIIQILEENSCALKPEISGLRETIDTMDGYTDHLTYAPSAQLQEVPERLAARVRCKRPHSTLFDEEKRVKRRRMQETTGERDDED